MLRLDLNLLWTIINLVVFYFLIKKFLIGPVTAIMDKRHSMIEEQLSAASTSESEALEMKQQYTQALAGVKDESDKIIAQAKQDAKTEYGRIVETANQESGKIKKNAQADIEAERQQAVREMQSQIANLAMTAAEKILDGQGGAEGDRLLYDQFLEEAGDADDANI